MVKVQQPNWFFEKEYYSNQKVLDAYRTFILSVVENLNPNDSMVYKKVDAMLNLEKKFAEVNFQKKSIN